MCPGDTCVPIPGTGKYCLIWKNDVCKYELVKDFEMRTFSWIMQMSHKFHHQWPCKRVSGRGRLHTAEDNG